MQDVMQTPNRIPSQVYYFEVNHGDVVTGVEKGKVAGEFIRTGDYSLADINRIIKIEEGQGIVLVQKNATDANGNLIPDMVEEFEAIQVNKGQEVVVSPGSFYALVNTDRENILVARHSGRSKNSLSNNPNSQILKEMGGFAYRIVAADSHVCLQPNKNYKEVKELKNDGIPRFGENLD